MKTPKRFAWEPAKAKAASAPVKRRKWEPFFNFKLAEWEARGYRNLAKCLGLTHRALFNWSLQHYAEEMERIVGIKRLAAGHLSKRQIAAHRARFEAMHPVGKFFGRPELQ